jgi:hypothetical protein
LRALGRIQATVEEAASVLRCSKRTLQYFFEQYPDERETFEEGRHEGCASLRRKQFAMAEKNATMAIWLGKQYLGQRDKYESEISGHVTTETVDKPPSETREEWIARRARELGVNSAVGATAGTTNGRHHS